MDKNNCEGFQRKLLIPTLMLKGTEPFNSAHKIISPEFQSAITWEPHRAAESLMWGGTSALHPTPCSKQGHLIGGDLGLSPVGVWILPRIETQLQSLSVLDHPQSRKAFSSCLNKTYCIPIYACCLLSCQWTPLRRTCLCLLAEIPLSLPLARLNGLRFFLVQQVL